MVILVGEAMAGSSITAVDSRTRRVQTVVEEDFFLQMQAPFTIEVFGLAMVKDTSLGASSSSTLNAELELNLEFVSEEQTSQDGQSISVSIDQSVSEDTQSILPPETQQSSSPTTTMSPTAELSSIPSSFPTISVSPTGKLALGAKICQCDQESNLCLNDNLLISYDSRDPINLCIV